MDKLITIAIASYNNAPYIERCIDSVIHQTYNNLEILVVDDGSNDDTLERTEKYRADKRIRIVSKENGGLSSVRQMCLETATGDYISFIDADDYLKEGYVENLYRGILEKEADVCLCSVRFEYEDGTCDESGSKSFSFPDSKNGYKLMHDHYANARVSFYGRFTLSDSWNKLYRTAFLRDTGIAFILPEGYNGTDAVFNQKVALHEPFYATVSYEGYVHVLYKKSAVHRRNKRLQEGFMIQMRQLLDECEKLGILQLMTDRMAATYYSYQLTAFEDVFKENSQDGRACRQLFKDMRRVHSGFLSENTILKRGRVYGRSLNIFKIVLNRMPILLPLLLKIRGRRR